MSQPRTVAGWARRWNMIATRYDRMRESNKNPRARALYEASAKTLRQAAEDIRTLIK